MFGRLSPRDVPFTDGVRRTLEQARLEAIALRHDYVGTEHILLGLVAQSDGIAASALGSAGIDAMQIRQRIADAVRKGKATIAIGELPFTSRAKKTLEYALASARDLGHSYVGTEHILLGLVREEKGIAGQVLCSLGLDANRAQLMVQRTIELRESGFEFRIQIDDASDKSIYEQIIAQIQEAVATGELAPGTRLPAVRQQADALNIAPGTVARAYSELERRKVVVTEGARGTRVADRAPLGVEGQDRADTLTGLLRPVAVAAFHLGASAIELRHALDRAMTGIFDDAGPAS